MDLITMAHLGEAQGVIESFQLKKTSSGLFEGENLCCLITGEGPFEAAIATANILGSRDFKRIINLGICGSLNSLAQVGTIHNVRSIYLVVDGQPQFKSFKAQDSGLDCITSFERILTPSKAQKLTGLGTLVDREAWGVAMAAKNKQIEFLCYKLISDQAGSLGACEVVKELAQVWAQKLAEFLKTIMIKKEKETVNQVELPEFYFTFTTRHQFDQLLNKISIRENKEVAQILKELPLSELRVLNILPKERSRLLINLLEERVDPLKAGLNHGLKKWKDPFEKQGIQLQTDPSWETPEVKVSFTVHSDQELQKKLKALNSLTLIPFENLRNGQIHVE